MDNYCTISAISTGEYSEKQSRFIATLYPADNTEQIGDILKEHRKKYWDAKHNVYAYILRDGSIKFSDDGEPHSTAGKPVLDVLSHSGICDILCVVTRYFGGTLLGTGGLVRAYTTATSEAVKNASIVKYEAGHLCKITCAYPDYDTLLKLILKYECTVLNTEFTDKISVEFNIKADTLPTFIADLTEVFFGKAECEVVSNIPIEVKI